MTAFVDLKRVCDSVSGRVEAGGPDGRSGNIIFVWDELQKNFQGQPYCAGGVSWTWKHAGRPFPAIDHPWGFSYCPDAVNWAKKNGLWLPNTGGEQFQPGDTLFFDWTGHGVADHTGIIMLDEGGTIDTFEYNTSPQNGSKDAQAQRNGGGCYYRYRRQDSTVLGVLQSSKWLVPEGKTSPIKKPPAPAKKVLRANPFPMPVLARGYLQQGIRADGPRGTQVRFVQWAAGAPVDGIWGPQTTAFVKAFQKYHGLKPDGVVGPQTLSVMSRVTR